MDELLNMIFKAVSVEPEYEEQLCLTAEGSAECTRCRDACPHDAVRVAKTVEIDAVDCSGCGLCVHSCPTNALEFQVGLERGVPLRCSQVKGSAQSIVCHGRLQATDLLRLSDRDGRIQLGRGDCANCPVGTSDVPDLIAAAVSKASELARCSERELSFEMVETDRLEAPANGRALSRRELFRGSWRTVKSGTAGVLAPLDPGRNLTGSDGGSDSKGPLPGEVTRRLASLRAARLESGDSVPWVLPRVNEACIMCPSCTEACPTDAFSRDFNPMNENGPALKLDPARCLGCNACVEACPVGAIRMDDQVTWAELSGGSVTAYRRSRSLRARTETGLAPSSATKPAITLEEKP